MISRRTLLASVAATACTHAPPGAPGDTQPFWLVSRGQARVYIFGAYNSATPAWSAPRVEAAFDRSRLLWKETADLTPEDQQKGLAAGRAGARPLSQWLTPQQKEIVASAAVEAGTTFAALEGFKPWLAATVINNGYSARAQTRSIDPVPILSARAVARGMPMRAEFPDMDSQLVWLNAMSDAAQVEFLLYFIENNRTPRDMVDRRRAAWAAGDLSLETRQVEHLKANFPDLYGPIERERNRAWPARIHQMLDEGGTCFVLVGADHMVGPDSVPAQLAAAGLTTRRV